MTTRTLRRTTLAFADDVAITCEHKNVAPTLKLIEQWSSDNKIPLNRDKSNILCIRADRRTPLPPIDDIEGVKLQITAKYLGVQFDDD